MSQSINPANLTKAWLHSREEDTATTSVYRPASYPFPPARGRNGFELKPDGSLLESGPGPTDKTQKTIGTWRLIDDDTLELATGTRSKTLKIKSVEADRLLVVK
jgi:hypothetical protein